MKADVRAQNEVGAILGVPDGAEGFAKAEEHLARVIREAEEAEREACAKIADARAHNNEQRRRARWGKSDHDELAVAVHEAELIADAIRSQGDGE